MTTIGFIGGGNIAEAMIRGLLRGKDFSPVSRRQRRVSLGGGIRHAVDYPR